MKKSSGAIVCETSATGAEANTCSRTHAPFSSDRRAKEAEEAALAMASLMQVVAFSSDGASFEKEKQQEDDAKKSEELIAEPVVSGSSTNTEMEKSPSIDTAESCTNNGGEADSSSEGSEHKSVADDDDAAAPKNTSGVAGVLTVNDVVFGGPDASISRNNIGNRRYRVTVQWNLPLYCRNRGTAKQNHVVDGVVDCVAKESSPAGRFFIWDDVQGKYVQMTSREGIAARVGVTFESALSVLGYVKGKSMTSAAAATFAPSKEKLSSNAITLARRRSVRFDPTVKFQSLFEAKADSSTRCGALHAIAELAVLTRTVLLDSEESSNWGIPKCSSKLSSASKEEKKMNPSSTQQEMKGKTGSSEKVQHQHLIKPTKNDVLCAATDSSLFSDRVGNMRFKVMVQLNLARYRDAPDQTGRTEILKSVLDAVSQCSPPARFLRPNGRSGWEELSPTVAFGEVDLWFQASLLESKDLATTKAVACFNKNPDAKQEDSTNIPRPYIAPIETKSPQDSKEEASISTKAGKTKDLVSTDVSRESAGATMSNNPAAETSSDKRCHCKRSSVKSKPINSVVEEIKAATVDIATKKAILDAYESKNHFIGTNGLITPRAAANISKADAAEYYQNLAVGAQHAAADARRRANAVRAALPAVEISVANSQRRHVVAATISAQPDIAPSLALKVAKSVLTKTSSSPSTRRPPFDASAHIPAALAQRHRSLQRPAIAPKPEAVALVGLSKSAPHGATQKQESLNVMTYSAEKNAEPQASLARARRVSVINNIEQGVSTQGRASKTRLSVTCLGQPPPVQSRARRVSVIERKEEEPSYAQEGTSRARRVSVIQHTKEGNPPQSVTTLTSPCLFQADLEDNMEKSGVFSCGKFQSQASTRNKKRYFTAHFHPNEDAGQGRRKVARRVSRYEEGNISSLLGVIAADETNHVQIPGPKPCASYNALPSKRELGGLPILTRRGNGGEALTKKVDVVDKPAVEGQFEDACDGGEPAVEGQFEDACDGEIEKSARHVSDLSEVIGGMMMMTQQPKISSPSSA